MGASVVIACGGVDGFEESTGVDAAEASPGMVSAIQTKVVSGPSPFAPHGCGVNAANGNWEWTTTVAASPNDPNNVVAAWVQDEALGIVVASTQDGGSTWERSTIPGLTTCTGGAYASAFRPKVAIGKNGVVYLATVLQRGPFDWSRPESTVDSAVGAIAVSRSINGGRTWSEPTYIIDVGTGDVLNHFDGLVVEPDNPDAAAVIWAKRSTQDVTFVSRTTDGGRTWTSLPVRVSQPGLLTFSRLAALPDGTLLVAYNEDATFGDLLPPVLPGTVSVIRSTDKGLTWSAPIQLDVDVAREHAELAVGPDGRVYASWRRYRPKTANSYTIMLSSSEDSGRTWRAPRKIVSYAASVVLPPPSLAVTADSTLGMLFSDTRNDVAGDAETRVDVWLRTSRDGSNGWSETHISSFRLDAVPYQDLGPYQELAGAGSGLRGVFVQGAPQALNGPTDVFVSKILF